MERDFRPVVALLRENIPGLVALYQFGSAVAGGERPDSDIDLAFLAEEALDPVRRFTLASQAARMLGREVDLVELRRADPVLLAQVIGGGRLLDCANPGQVAAFETTALARYCALNEERRELLADIQARGRIYAR